MGPAFAPQVTIMRDPVTRFVSAWHYRCHHPNYDCFNVREEFKAIRESRGNKKTFSEYCQMREYQNIMVKVTSSSAACFRPETTPLNDAAWVDQMLVKDKFPYTDCGPLGPLDLEQGKRNLDKFVFVGLNEMYDTSMVLLGEALAIPLQPQV